MIRTAAFSGYNEDAIASYIFCNYTKKQLFPREKKKKLRLRRGRHSLSFLYIERLPPLRTQVVLQNYRSTYLVYQRLVLACLTTYSTVKYRLMCQYRRETLIEELDRNIGHLLAPLRNKLLDTCQVLARLAVHLAWFAYYNTLNRLTRDIILKIFHKVGRCHSGQSARNNLQRISNCQASALLAVVN